jgi:hypothetical protein
MIDHARAGIWAGIVALSALCWIGVACGVRAALVVLGTITGSIDRP